MFYNKKKLYLSDIQKFNVRLCNFENHLDNLSKFYFDNKINSLSYLNTLLEILRKRTYLIETNFLGKLCSYDFQIQLRKSFDKFDKDFKYKVLYFDTRVINFCYKLLIDYEKKENIEKVGY